MTEADLIEVLGPFVGHFTSAQIAMAATKARNQIAREAEGARQKDQGEAMNIELLRQAVDYIKAHPDEWVQESFVPVNSCGTGMCLAGHVAALAGAKPMETFLNWSANPLATPTVARKLLGLSTVEAVRLFWPNRTIADFERVLETGNIIDTIPAGLSECCDVADLRGQECCCSCHDEDDDGYPTDDPCDQHGPDPEGI